MRPQQRINEEDLCTYIAPDGAKCRAGKVPTREVCIAHWRYDGQFIADPLANAELASLASTMKTSRGINRFLAALVRLTSEDRVSSRKATLLAYQAQLALYALGRPARQSQTQREAEALDDSLPLTAAEPPAAAGKPNGHGPNGSEPAHAE